MPTANKIDPFLNAQPSQSTHEDFLLAKTTSISSVINCCTMPAATVAPDTMKQVSIPQ